MPPLSLLLSSQLFQLVPFAPDLPSKISTNLEMISTATAGTTTLRSSTLPLLLSLLLLLFSLSD
jgi:hypothetical protein